jgi:hypothetical protein
MESGMTFKDKRVELAKESFKTKKERDKLLKKFAFQDTMITSRALEEKTLEIRNWIDRHASARAVLKAKNIALFDENQNTAKVSKKVAEIAEQLRSVFSNVGSK